MIRITVKTGLQFNGHSACQGGASWPGDICRRAEALQVGAASNVSTSEVNPGAVSMMNRRDLLLASASASLLAACGVADDKPAQRNAFQQVNLVASKADTGTFKPTLTSTERGAEFIDAWGIAIRPAGAGGHFWVTAGGWSYQFVGDVGASGDAALKTIFQDALTLVRIPGAGVPQGEPDVTNTEKFEGFATGVVFNGAELTSNKFVVRGQKVTVDGVEQTLEGSARFIFATDSGVISGWTERNASSNSVVRRNGPAVEVINGRADGHAYFGLAVKPGTWDRLWAADFGANPQLRAFDAQWQPLDLGSAFANPFLAAGRSRPVPGDYVPFNVQVLDVAGRPRVFIAYAKSQADPQDPSKFFAGEEDAIAAAQETAQPDRGRVAMFDLDGKLERAFADDKRLNAPWGLAVAPAQGFGVFSGALLVGNFGGKGRIAGFDIERGTFLGFLTRDNGDEVAIEGLWALQFGNGVSLGDSNALYFAAGPGEETQGLFGALRYVVG
jgi:uncharacterized protein (TIGR03118 family)